MEAILVTGAAGFIGSHTCDQLLAGGHTVVGVDNFRTGRRENLRGAEKHARFRLVEADVSDAAAFDPLVRDSTAAAIIHLAALVSVPESMTNPEMNFRLNLHATHVVADAARRHRVPRVVFASSAAVYGDALDLPLEESRHPRAISPYGGAKLASEALLLSDAAAFGFTAFCLRYFNVYGPRQDPRSPYSGVLSIFVDKLRARAAPTIFGDGEQTRDFISVHDIARANAAAATRTDLRSGVANICSGRATSLNAIVEIFRQLVPGFPAALHAAPRAGDIRHSLGSNARAAAELGFGPQVDLKDGLSELLRATQP